MIELTQRQKDILRAIIEKYITTAVPVGSEILEKEYTLGVSPATIRNEMVRLTELGYIQKPHTSAGRIPTPMGLKFYIQELMDEKSLSVKDEVLVKEHLWQSRFEHNKLLRDAVHELSKKTGTLAVATDNEGQLFAAGAANILDMPEFYDIDLTKEVLGLLDEIDRFNALFLNSTFERDISVLFGEELGQELLAPCGFVFTQYKDPTAHSGYIGVIGPMRLNYPVVIPVLRYFRSLLSEVSPSY